MKLKRSPLRVLYFDVEARPLGWYAGDNTHKEVTVAAWCWRDGTPDVRTLTKDDRTRLRMLKAWRNVYDQADMVVGHYIRSFDLPLLNAMLTEAGEPPLGMKLTHDTKQDLTRLHGISKSQENLSALLGVDVDKIRLTVSDWRRANRLTDLDASIERAVGDVVQNMALHATLLERRLLGPPRSWRP